VRMIDRLSAARHVTDGDAAVFLVVAELDHGLLHRDERLRVL
jgi:hypothetical protein